MVRKWSESCVFEFEFYNLFGAWNLEFGIWNLEPRTRGHKVVRT